MLIQLAHVGHSFPPGFESLFDNVTLSLDEGDRVVALIGANGSGKSSLLKILAGQLVPSSGQVWRRDTLRCQLIDQMINPAGLTLLELAWSGIPEGLDAARAFEQAVLRCATDSGRDAFAALEMAQAQFDSVGGYDREAALIQALNSLGWDPDRPAETLSGGEAMRVRGLGVASTPHDVLLLDEPTNHLDEEALDSLTRQLQEADRPHVVISHDVAFLDALATRTWALDHGTLVDFPGKPSEYLAWREADRQSQQAMYHEAQQRIRHLESERDRRTRWAHRAEKGKRGAFDKGRVGKLAARVMKRGQNAAQAIDRIIERERPERPDLDWEPLLDLSRAGSHLASLHIERIAYQIGNRQLIHNLSLSLRGRDRVLVTGPNGAGKSTLLKLAAGQLWPSAGSVRRRGDWLFLDQTLSLLKPDDPLLDQVTQLALDESEVRTALGRCGLLGDVVMQPVKLLSPGERGRALLALLEASQAEALILDEPSNHLDIAMRQTLKQALSQFPGPILLAGHDVDLMSALGGEQIRLPQDDV